MFYVAAAVDMTGLVLSFTAFNTSSVLKLPCLVMSVGNAETCSSRNYRANMLIFNRYTVMFLSSMLTIVINEMLI